MLWIRVLAYLDRFPPQNQQIAEWSGPSTSSRALQWSPWLHRAAHLSMNPPVQLWWWGACPTVPKTKQKNSAEHTPAPVNCAATTACPAPLWPPFQTPCPRLTSQPARSLLSLVTRCPPDTAHGRGQLNSHCSPHRVRSLVGHHHCDSHPELSNPDSTAPTGPNQTSLSSESGFSIIRWRLSSHKNEKSFFIFLSSSR